jgi:predicted nucleic acid-binding protein
LGNKRVFIDTSYVFALINPNDQWHPKAIEWKSRITAHNLELIISEFVLAEIADGLSSVAFRKAASRSIRLLQADPCVEIVPASSSLFERALDMFENRPDKGWGLTDCTSFVIMADYDVSDALTTDGHFEQAGFKPLLRG